MTLQTRRARESGGLGVTQLAEILDMDKSQVSRSLKVLTEYGMVDRDPRRAPSDWDGESSTWRRSAATSDCWNARAASSTDCSTAWTNPCTSRCVPATTR
ncbi:helix-turn-helix domain-containing protein [Rhodococcus hoagii]|nr:helix-turn-helix domain-containing protein [Prescottella equi]